MSEFWQNKIKAFLHDPPDKALILFHKSHKSKRDKILDELNLKYDERLDITDYIASAMQRLYIPEDYRMDNARNCNAHICFKGMFKPVFKHTLSGAEENFEEITKFIADYGYEKVLEKYGFNSIIVKTLLKDNWKKTYFLLWRFLPEIYNPSLSYFLPADTRIPDHSIWDHLDITAAISSCLGDIGLFALKIPAVQEFISHSRKLSDLWASSHIFSTIIFEGIKVIIEKYGPDIVIYPQLRGNPLVDLIEFGDGFILFNEGINLGLIKKNNIRERLQIANFPNTFLCFISASEGDEICKEVEKAIKQKWKDIVDKAKGLLNKESINIDKKLWENQVENVIEITSAWLEFFNFDRFSKVKDKLPNDLKQKQEKWLSFVEEPERRSNPGHFYSVTYEILGIILAQKSRLWKAWKEEPITGKKCLMCGRRNAILKRSPNVGYHYWTGNSWKNVKVSKDFENTLKVGERLCAVCLVKRLYKDIFKNLFKAKPPEFESVVDIAARDFIEEAKTNKILAKIMEKDIELIYEHEWGESEDKIPEEKRETIEELLTVTGKSWKGLKEEVKRSYELYSKKPNKYYAILMIDGDRIGKTLSGETLPNFGEFLHPVFKNEILKWKKGKDLVEKTKRILTSSHHIAISRAMKDFSLYKVPEIVKKYRGFLVYAGGDDVLALFPADKVLEAAKEIQKYFRKDFYEIDVNGKKRRVMGLGNNASMSAGIVFTHYKWPLYSAIEKVREAEKNAKGKYGRGAFCITFIKRSGEILTAGGKWDFIIDLIDIAKAVVNRKISHRFIYDFMEVSEILKSEMLKAEIRRLLRKRKEDASDKEIKELQEKLLCLIEKYEAQSLSAKEIGNALKILYDAYRGEEKR